MPIAGDRPVMVRGTRAVDCPLTDARPQPLAFRQIGNPRRRAPEVVHVASHALVLSPDRRGVLKRERERERERCFYTQFSEKNRV